MNHINENVNSVLLQISRQQALFQARQNQLHDLLAALSVNSYSIAALATIPMVEADLGALNSMSDRISQNIQSVSCG